MRVLSYLAVMYFGVVSGLAAAPSPELPVATVRIRSVPSDCRSLELDANNLVAFTSLPDSTQPEIVVARLIYRIGDNRLKGGRQSLEMRLTRDDLGLVASEIEALIRRARIRPLRFESERQANGRCQVVRVLG